MCSVDSNRESLINSLIEETDARRFQTWYDEYQTAQNLRDGATWLNTPPDSKPPRQHSPSQLTQCHRKITYRQLNAPEETEDPDGIFWVGERIEEDILMPFLESVVGERAYVCNSLWIDSTIETETGDIHIKGQTDPVVVEADGQPILPTEIKSKETVDHLDAPNRHHLDQTYAYMDGLSREWPVEVTDALIIYVGRQNLDINVFHVSFDSDYWERLLDWATAHTAYRLRDELPPANPEFGWECDYCSYQVRCGQTGDDRYENSPPEGLLPGFSDYPRSKVVEYLTTHPEAKLTPTLATRYPSLTERFNVQDWRCEACGSEYDFESIDTPAAVSEQPQCPQCRERGVPSSLRDPPLKQSSEMSSPE